MKQRLQLQLTEPIPLQVCYNKKKKLSHKTVNSNLCFLAGPYPAAVYPPSSISGSGSASTGTLPENQPGGEQPSEVSPGKISHFLTVKMFQYN